MLDLHYRHGDKWGCNTEFNAGVTQKMLDWYYRHEVQCSWCNTKGQSEYEETFF